MDAQLINRVGIVFTFLGGFLIAPELIGLKRIKILEGSFEKILFNIHSWIDEYLADLRVDPKYSYSIGSETYVYRDERRFLISFVIGLIYASALLLAAKYFGFTWNVEWLRIIAITFALVWGTSSLAMILNYFHNNGSQYMSLADLIGEIIINIFFLAMLPAYFPFVLVMYL